MDKGQCFVRVALFSWSRFLSRSLNFLLIELFVIPVHLQYQLQIIFADNFHYNSGNHWLHQFHIIIVMYMPLYQLYRFILHSYIFQLYYFRIIALYQKRKDKMVLNYQLDLNLKVKEKLHSNQFNFSQLLLVYRHAE